MIGFPGRIPLKTAVALFALALVCAAAHHQKITVPSGSTVYVDTNNGFDIFILAAFQEKHVPLRVVPTREKAEYILDSSLFHDAGFVATAKTAGTYRISSGITSKPAIEGHFKTGQRTITLDELVLPYRTAVWQLQFDPIRSLPSDHQPGILQDLIPVFPFLCRELSFEN
jgi:hypothetical protein